MPGSILMPENSMLQKDKVLVWSSHSVEAIHMDLVKTQGWDESRSRDGWEEPGLSGARRIPSSTKGMGDCNGQNDERHRCSSPRQ